MQCTDRLFCETDFLDCHTIPQALERYRENEEKALICGDESLSYRELLEGAKRIAQALGGEGIKKGDHIILGMERSVSFFTALFGILYAGGSFVSVDPDWPEERLRFIARDSAAVMNLDDDMFHCLWEKGESEIENDISLPVIEGRDEFAVFYTSGSTGEPKGCVTHHQVIFHTAAPFEENSHVLDILKKCDTIFSMGNPAFCFINYDIFSCFLCGKTLVFATGEEMADPSLLGKKLKSCLNCALTGTPSHILTCLKNKDFREGFQNVKRLMIGGEFPYGLELIREAAAPDASLYNVYGNTETGMLFFTNMILGDERYFDNCVNGTELILLDENDRPVPDEKKGEICIGGIPAQYGYYIGRDNLTKKKYKRKSGFGRIYHTGDLGFRDREGKLYLAGRMDDMKKLHGQRLELREIELCMERFPGVEKAVADVRGEGADAILCAWFTSGNHVDPRLLRKHLSLSLPAYMVPARMKELKEIPLTSSGKQNRSLLPDIETERNEYRQSGSERERAICEAFEIILGQNEPVGIGDDFFLTGGNSLMAMHLLSYLREHYGYLYSMRDLFMNPTPEGLSLIHHEGEGGTEDSVTTGPEKLNDLLPLDGQETCLIPEDLQGIAEDKNTQAILSVSSATLYYLIAKSFRSETQRNINRLRVSLNGTWDEAEYNDRLFRLIENHPALRSDFIKDYSGFFWQVIYKRKTIPAFYKNLKGMSKEGQKRYVNGFWQVLEEEDALFACALLIISEKESILLVRADHTVVDGVSLSVILNELTACNYRDLSCDKYVEHRRRMIRSASEQVPEYIVQYYKDLPARFKMPSGTDIWKTSYIQEHLTLSNEDTSILTRRSRKAGATLYTFSFLCYSKALMRFYGTEEIWIRYLSHGRRSEGTDEMRLVGNLITEKPVHIKLDTTAGELQSDMLALDAFSGMADTTLFGKRDPNGLLQGLISNDFEKSGPMINKIVPIENGPVDGNSVYMEEGRLNFRFGRLPMNMPDDGQASWKELFLRELFSAE